MSKKKINLYLRDGTEYLGKSVPNHPFHADRFFCFFEETGGLTYIPWDLIKKIENCDE